MKPSSILNTIVIAIFILKSNSIFALDKYTETMLKNIDVVYSSDNIEELQKAVNVFDRIGEAEKTKWEPFYYSAFGHVLMSNLTREASAKDAYLDLAMTSISKAKALAPSEAELIALEGFAHMIRVTVDPATRGQQYAGLAMQSFNKALAISPGNPRAMALLAQMQYGTAQFFGSPTTEACATALKAVEQFDTFTSDNPLAPKWGRGMAEDMLKKCEN